MDIDIQCVGASKAPKPFDALWFPDGNIVLATDTHLFKVHKSIISLHSTAFSDMLQLVTVDDLNFDGADQGPDGIEQETYEGLPLVKLVGDDGEDVSRLLRAVYEPNFYRRDDDNTPLKTIVALLLLSTKYDFKHIRTDVILQISRHYPLTLNAYCAFNDKSKLFGRTRLKCHLLLLEAAFKADVDVLLPTLYYACAVIPVVILQIKQSVLPPECMALLLKGKSDMECTISKVVARFPGEALKESGAHICRNEGCMKDGPFLVENLDEFISVVDLRLIDGERVVERCFKTCKTCRTKLVKIINERRKRLWGIIPFVFAALPWEELQAKLDVIVSEGSGAKK